MTLPYWEAASFRALTFAALVEQARRGQHRSTDQEGEDGMGEDRRSSEIVFLMASTAVAFEPRSLSIFQRARSFRPGSGGIKDRSTLDDETDER